MKSRPQRSEVPIEQTWDLTPLFATVADWEAAAAAVEAEADSFAATYKGRLGESASVLLACLRERDALAERQMKVARYASNRYAVESTSPECQALQARAGAVGAKYASALSFLVSEVQGIADERMAAFLAAEPGLAEYRFHIESLRAERAHMLSAETEAVLAELTPALGAPYTMYRAITGADMKFPAVQDADGDMVTMSIARYAKLAQSRDREVRRRAYESLTAGLGAHKTALATALANHINKEVTTARLRGFGSALEMHLFPTGVSVQVYNNVLDTILKQAAPHVRRYMQLRKRVHGLDQVHRYDMNLSLDPDFNAAMTYEEGIQVIKDGLAVLGPEYGAVLDQAFSERWIDRADNEGKEHGAFNSGIYGWHPVIMMTWSDNIRNTFTLAHELGHCCHRYLSSVNQNFINSGLANLGRFFLEAPSTANEALLGGYLLERTTDVRRRRYIIESFLGTFMHNMVTHLLEADLERRLFALAEARKPITLKTIMQLQGQVFEEFFGDTVVVDEGARLTWTMVPHFYMGFYPLVYAAGLSAGCAVAEAIRKEGEPAVQRWLAAIKAGSTMHPLDLYKLAGIDMSTPEPVEQAVGLFGRLIADLEESYK